MKNLNRRTLVPVILWMCLLAIGAPGCSDATTEKPVARGQTESNQPAESSVILDDGVYPILPGDEAAPKIDPGIKIVELVNVPVEGSDDSTTEKIRVIGQPLLRFRNVSHFDFTFEKNECTEIGFQNSEELKAYTRNHIGSQLAVVIDNQVISHHKIQEAIESDQVQITCCTQGGGDHLHKYLKELKLASNANSQFNEDH